MTEAEHQRHQRQQRAESAEHVRTPAEPNLEFVPCPVCTDRSAGICSICESNRATIEALRADLRNVELYWNNHFKFCVEKERAKAYEDMAEWCDNQAKDAPGRGERWTFEGCAAECRKRAKESEA